MTRGRNAPIIVDTILDNLDEKQAVAILEHLASFSGPTSERLTAMLTGAAPEVPPVAEAEPDAAPRSRMWEPDLRYRSLVEKLPVVTFMASLNDTVQEMYVSPQIEKLLGFTQEEWLENPILWFQQLHPDDRDKWVDEFARTCAEGANFRAEYRLIARDGRIVWVQGECQLIRDDENRPLFLQGIAFDITHLKNAAKVDEARRAAEAANSAKSEFLARMSHEIRTPLNGVVGMIDLLSATGLNDMQQRYAQLAREAADALLMVINDILDFSKIEAGKVEVEAIEFDLQKIIEDLTVLLAPVAGKKKLAIASFVRPQIPRQLQGDPNRVRQVITNLITNAIKFTERGQISVRAARLEDDSDASVRVRVEVQDTGIGIPTDRLDRLFKSFSQVDTSTTRKFGGTGLGLVICKRLVELMGGEIGINSTVGEGTTFWFTLKLGAVASGDVPLEPSEALRTARVLVVESEKLQQRIVAEQLDGRLHHAPVVVGYDGALAALRQGAAEGTPFAVALIPFGPDTAELASAVRGDPSLGHTKLIAVTSLEEKTQTDAILQAGYFARLQRPLTQSLLVDSIASATVMRPGRAVNQDKAAAASGVSLKGMHVLVAEDNEMNQFVTQQTLLRVGCTCDIVADGAQAIEAVTKKPYAAVLMDCQMPGIDGLEATRLIREREASGKARRIPIIALTAEAIAGDREKCLAAGMDGYVSKPINANDLFKELGSIVGSALISTPLSSAGPLLAGQPPAAKERAAVVESEGVPIDIESLLTRCMKDSAFATQLLTKFTQRAAGDVELLRAGVAAGDTEAARRLAHNLKSVAAHVSAEKLRGIAFEIEQAGARHDLEFMERQLGLLDREAQRCASYIPRAIEELNKKP